jgi:hypothetical protein
MSQDAYLIANVDGTYREWTPVPPVLFHYQNVDEAYGSEDDDTTYMRSTDTTSPYVMESFRHYTRPYPGNIYITRLRPVARVRNVYPGTPVQNASFRVGIRFGGSDYMPMIWNQIAPDGYQYVSGSWRTTDPTGARWTLENVALTESIAQGGYTRAIPVGTSLRDTAQWLNIQFEYAHEYVRRCME